MTQFNQPGYKIDKPTRRCAFTEQDLEPGEPYIATLVEDEQPPASNPDDPDPETPGSWTLKRLDLSASAWDQGQRPERLFSHWRTKVPHPNEKKNLFVDDQVLMDMLRRLGDTDEPSRLGFRFVLALILMRKRKLRYDGVSTVQLGDQQRECWKLTVRGTGGAGSGETEVLEVINPGLDEEQIAQVAEQLSQILETDL